MGEKPLILLVTGGRTYCESKVRPGCLPNAGERFTIDMERTHIAKVLDETMPRELWHGGADGTDKRAERWARDRGVTTRVFPADWNRFGRGAGPKRNRQMATAMVQHRIDTHGRFDYAVVAFPGGRGTADMVQVGAQMGIMVRSCCEQHPLPKWRDT